MNYPEISGRVQVIQPVQTFASGFSKQCIVVDTGRKYPSPILVTFKKEKAALLAGLQVGDCVTVGYALDGREHNGRFFVDVVGLTLAKQQQGTVAKAAGAAGQTGYKFAMPW